MTYRDQVAIVTGAASGIGRALAAELVRRGAKVVLADRDEERVREAAAALAGEGPHAPRGEPLDVAIYEQVEALVKATAEREGRLDLLFNNAGVGLAGEVRDTTLADWRKVMEVNLFGVIHGVHAAYPLMIAQGSGHIVNTASGAGLLPRPGMTPYAASKHAVVGLSVSLRAEAVHLGVRVSAVCPGFIATGIMDRTTYRKLDQEQMVAQIPIRGLSPEACANRVLKGVRKNRAIIPVTALTRLEWLLYRWWPGLGQRAADWRGRKMSEHRTE
jgi:NAD(P)-dependent dehydrogenase (short-subunit alcohol dehydrogenase family)